MAEIEILKNIQPKSIGGARPGAGRPKHGKNQSTIVKEEAERQFKERVAKNVDRLFNSQLDLALGEKYLMVTTTIGTGTRQRRETSIVTDPQIIKQFLDDESSLNDDTEYYFMSTKPANNQALEGMMNRAFGRAKESLELSGDKENPVTVNILDFKNITNDIKE
jgi:hypothetical protein